ncbi:MAG: zinc ribbon domain-containing protein [Candidatus Thermoplasmatota archaeon]
MLERRDYRVIPGVKAADVWAKTWDWWQRAGFALQHVGPNHFTGASVYSKIGLRREAEVRFTDANDALYVDLAFRAHFTEAGAVGGAVAAVLFWPAVVVGGALSWSEYENEANALLASFWNFLWQTTGKPSQIVFATAPPFGTPYAVRPQPAPPTAASKVCEECGAGLAPGWKACPWCGQPIPRSPDAAGYFLFMIFMKPLDS